MPSKFICFFHSFHCTPRNVFVSSKNDRTWFHYKHLINRQILTLIPWLIKPQWILTSSSCGWAWYLRLSEIPYTDRDLETQTHKPAWVVCYVKPLIHLLPSSPSFHIPVSLIARLTRRSLHLPQRRMRMVDCLPQWGQSVYFSVCHSLFLFSDRLSVVVSSIDLSAWLSVCLFLRQSVPQCNYSYIYHSIYDFPSVIYMSISRSSIRYLGTTNA